MWFVNEFIFCGYAMIRFQSIMTNLCIEDYLIKSFYLDSHQWPQSNPSTHTDKRWWTYWPLTYCFTPSVPQFIDHTWQWIFINSCSFNKGLQSLFFCYSWSMSDAVGCFFNRGVTLPYLLEGDKTGRCSWLYHQTLSTCV